MNVLLSIKPHFVQKIANKDKSYEFRKAIFKNATKKVFIYSSSPVKKIIGYFLIENIIKDNPIRLWELCEDNSGINKKDFFNYFQNRDKGYAIKIGKLIIYDNPLDPYKKIPNFIPPQSFCYLKGTECELTYPE